MSETENIGGLLSLALFIAALGISQAYLASSVALLSHTGEGVAVFTGLHRLPDNDQGGQSVSIAESALLVHECGDGLQVLRVDTATHAAQMVQLETLRYRPVQQLVESLVCDKRALPHLDLGVATARLASKPQPTARHRLRENVPHDALVSGEMADRHYAIVQRRACGC